MPSQKTSPIIKFCIVLAVLVGLGIIARFTVFAPFEMSGSSMKDTLNDNDWMFVNKMDSTIERGDIVIFHVPDADDSYVKRVIGIGGDTIVIEGGTVSLNGTLLDEPYLTIGKGKTYRYPPAAGDESKVSFTVPENSYFVLGDNREGSLDSRSFGEAGGSPFIPAKDIVGTVWFQ